MIPGVRVHRQVPAVDGTPMQQDAGSDAKQYDAMGLEIPDKPTKLPAHAVAISVF